MTILEAVIQGVIQGATEFLPVSSSGHLSISQHIFGIELPGILFDIMLHLGTPCLPTIPSALCGQS